MKVPSFNISTPAFHTIMLATDIAVGVGGDRDGDRLLTAGVVVRPVVRWTAPLRVARRRAGRGPDDGRLEI